MDVAVNGESKGGVLGNAQAAGASLMTGFIDYFGARNIQREATASGDAAGAGNTGAAIAYGTGAGFGILLSASAGWTGGGGAGATGVRLSQIGWYEVGSQSIKGDIFEKLAAQGLTDDKVALGKYLWETYGWKEALFHSGELKPGSADWRMTFPAGPTPGGYVGLNGATRGAQQYLTSHCPEGG